MHRFKVLNKGCVLFTGASYTREITVCFSAVCVCDEVLTATDTELSDADLHPQHNIDIVCDVALC